ncbi:MAG TPA: helix-turn-helix domain-containing protein [Kofleriaceae bacterium]|jgi:transcriptional regulator GlxA family with amidase domain
MRIAVLVLDDIFDTGLSAVLDAFETADQLSEVGRFEVTAVGVRARAHTHHGLAVPVVAPPSRAPDLVVVPAIACKRPDELLPALERPDVADAMDLLRRWEARGTRIAAACTGTFVLGKAGLLDGKRATTTWWLGPTFRKEFPAVELEDKQMVVIDRGVITAGAALAHLDLVLALIRDRSPNLASLVARHLVLDDRASQAPFVATAHVAYDDELVKRFETWLRRRIAEPFELAKAARAIGTSERTLQRRVRAVLGKRPIELVQEIRLERAVHLLRTTKHGVDEIAQAVGYEDGSTLRTLLRRRLGTGVRELRRA